MNPNFASRRHFLATQSMTIGSLALAWLLKQDGVAAEPSQPQLEAPTYDLLPKKPPAEPQARAMISMFMQGGPSHVDLFDPKPELTSGTVRNTRATCKLDNVAQATSQLFGSPWKFEKHGQCGMELSELLPHLGSVADDICLIRSMHSGVNNHGQAIFALNSGRPLAGRPALGSWVTYAPGDRESEFTRLRRADRSHRAAGRRGA